MRISRIAALILAILSLCPIASAQKPDTPEPLPDNASFEVTKKWLLSALKHNFLFYVPRGKHDKTRYRMQELKFEDCLLSYSIYREAQTPAYPILPADIPDSSVAGIGSKTIGSSPGDTSSGRPMNLPNTNSGQRKPGRAAGFVDHVLLDLTEIDPASLKVLQLSRSKDIAHLQALNRSLSGPNVITKVVATAADAKVSLVTRPTQGGIISLKTESAETIKAGLAYAIKLCQAPSVTNRASGSPH